MVQIHMGMKESASEAQAKAAVGKSWLKCRPIGIGSMAGQNVMSNDAFQTLVDTNDKWISKRTGIRNRHMIKKGSTLRDLGVESARQALSSSGTDAKDIDLVIVATSTPDDLFGDAGAIASAIGATNAAAFDITAACSGFVYGLVTASQFINSGAYTKVLVVGADALTRFLDWEDRGTCILFGDGAGATVVEATDSIDESGILGFALHSDGGRAENLRLAFESDFQELSNEEKSVVDRGEYGKMYMNGPEVYKFAVNEVPDVIAEGLTNAGLAPSDVDWLLLHQANIRIMEHAADVLGIPMDKVLRNINEYGNTSAGSIPLALAEAVREGKVKKGDIIACAGFGAGLSWASVIIKWGGNPGA
jgi:3-oxoacyl-[acyl-carrier-protein] synthase III